MICKGLPIEPGDALRLSNHDYSAYGIEITPENRSAFRNCSLASYSTEWGTGDSESNDAISRALERIGLGDGDNELNKGQAQVAGVAVMDASEGKKPDEPIIVIDYGAGTGRTSDAFLQVMGNNDKTVELAGRCELHLVDFSEARLSEAGERLDKNTINERLESRGMRLNYELEQGALETHLENQPDGSVDLIISSAALHHCSFPDHFDQMYRVLKDNGVLIIGDWHNSLFSNPANLINLLRRLGANKDRLDAFQNLFNVSEDDATAFSESLKSEERIANILFANFIVAMSNELKGVKQESRLCFLEALVSVEKRAEDIKRSGIVMDSGELGARFKGLKRVAGSMKGDLVGPVFATTTVACVMVGAKIR
jgi:ubiquinone/menaquinone biosynthesis C-methylase UbiE